MHDEAPWFQSARGDAYAVALRTLLAAGDAFACHCSRSEIEAVGGVHRRCVGHAHTGREPAIRLRVPDGVVVFHDRIQGLIVQDLGREVGDFVLRRSDGYWAYQLAVVVDDADQGITDVVRGADLLDSTPRQILLQRALGLPQPRYAHLPLLLDSRGRKLSKTDAAHPVDPNNPLPALRTAWSELGQPADALATSHDLPGLLAAAQAAFDPHRIPATASTKVAAMQHQSFTM